MNIQTERLENHKAQLTVEIDAERLDRAKVTAAREISKRVNVPGFRKGKAPYKRLVNHIGGEAAIVEEAVETLSNEVYKEALKQSEIEPYGPGELENFKLEPNPTFVFTVPLQPSVELNDYRSVRLEYEAPVIDDEMVNRALKTMQQQAALVEESQQPVEIGSQVTIDVHAFLVDEAEADSEKEPDADDTENADAADHDEHVHDADMVFMHNHDLPVRLVADEEPILPGFKEAMLGAAVGESRAFELTVPDNEEEYDDDIRGRRVRFEIVVKKVDTVTLPVLNDDFAAHITESEDTPLTLPELRMRLRKNMEEEAERRAKADYGGRMLDKIVEQAAIAYPEELVRDQTEDMLEDLDGRLRQQGLTLDDYMKVMSKTKEDLFADYREPAARSVERQLAMLELLRAERLKIADETIENRLEELVASFGERSEAARSLFNTPQIRLNITNNLLQEKLYERLADIGQGREIPVAAEDDTDIDQEEASQDHVEADSSAVDSGEMLTSDAAETENEG